MEKTTQELFKEELEALLKKYPTCGLQVGHTISIMETPQAE